MTGALQASLFDVEAEGPSFTDLRTALRRTHLTAGAWIDVASGWISGSDSLFTSLVDAVPWRAERRQMYDRVVDVPRLQSFYSDPTRLPEPFLLQVKSALDEHYRVELGENFTTAGLCYYRDGGDSVAWHADDGGQTGGRSGSQKGRGASEDTMVAIVSLGAARPLLLRPRGGGPSIRHSVGHGDLLVMGGSCQRTWEHCIPKSTRPTGPRISIQFRPRGVR
ncbi:alkylated DNA repair protein [Rhodococcoides trifolii]|uniref:Alkylated DNA repair protein n=1 Tax=Rhodococcoides trifolii TaxID=908250 RepID=A0A917G4R6_9NOCA|nr:alpha-ketoglutarate-dependent dioxygenase AlkB [Rhodococcus trifolii]GGG22631.1 alkylated DNA repair protein [Rhodococcus trifolii]